MSKTLLEEKTDRRRLGWLAAGMLSFLLSSPAWALDLDQSIRLQESDSAQILQTLGHGQRVNHTTSRSTKKKVRLVLLRSHGRKKV